MYHCVGVNWNWGYLGCFWLWFIISLSGLESFEWFLYLWSCLSYMCKHLNSKFGHYLDSNSFFFNTNYELIEVVMSVGSPVSMDHIFQLFAPVVEPLKRRMHLRGRVSLVSMEVVLSNRSWVFIFSSRCTVAWFFPLSSSLCSKGLVHGIFSPSSFQLQTSPL